MRIRTLSMKATDEDVLAAVDGEMCAEQAEKLRIIRSHMDSLEMCKVNLESLILTTAEKYLPQLNLVMTVPGIRSFAAIVAWMRDGCKAIVGLTVTQEVFGGEN